MYRLLILPVFALALATGFAEDKPGKEQVVEGVIKKVDPSANKITIATKDKDKKPLPDREFEVANTTVFFFLSGTEKKDATGKDGFKKEWLKEGAEVAVVLDGTGKPKEIRISKLPTPEKK